MMSTTVRVREDDKARLDELQARFTLTTGQKIPLDELIARLLDLALDHEDELMLTDEGPRLSPDEIEAFHRGITDSGQVTTEEDIDRILYGGEDAA